MIENRDRDTETLSFPSPVQTQSKMKEYFEFNKVTFDGYKGKSM